MTLPDSVVAGFFAAMRLPRALTLSKRFSRTGNDHPVRYLAQVLKETSAEEASFAASLGAWFEAGDFLMIEPGLPE